MEDHPVQQSNCEYVVGQERTAESRLVSLYLSSAAEHLLRPVAGSRCGHHDALAHGFCCPEWIIEARQVGARTHWLITRLLILPSVRHIVLDEADRMLDTEFLDQVQEVVAACTYPGVQKAVFSATLPANAEKIAMGMLRDPIRVVLGLKYVPCVVFHS